VVVQIDVLRLTLAAIPSKNEPPVITTENKPVELEISIVPIIAWR
jgi:hypothetical protein